MARVAASDSAFAAAAAAAVVPVDVAAPLLAVFRSVAYNKYHSVMATAVPMRQTHRAEGEATSTSPTLTGR